MPAIDVVKQTEISRSIRCQQLEAMFDVPPQDRSELRWAGDVDIDQGPWNVGLIVGPSGCGKTTVAEHLFAGSGRYEPQWSAPAVIDDFAERFSVEEIAEVCAAVGFNTVPAWFRPYSVLSTGEQFRVSIARRLMEMPDPIVVDEFTSVVDRQVAKIGAHAVQKYVRKHNRRFVAVTCHYDVSEWLMPDWILEPATMDFQFGRWLQQRPQFDATIQRVPHDYWRLFAPYHYLTAELSRQARCFCMFIDDLPIAFVGVLHRPNWRKAGQNIKGISRIVTLPDWQGLGAGPILAACLGAAYKALGWRLRAYPAHPALIRVADKSPVWALKKKPGFIQKTNKKNTGKRTDKCMRNVSRPCAVFEYCGAAMDFEAAKRLIDG